MRHLEGVQRRACIAGACLSHMQALQQLLRPRSSSACKCQPALKHAALIKKGFMALLL